MSIKSRRRNRRMRNKTAYFMNYMLPATLCIGPVAFIMYWAYLAAKWDCANGFWNMFCVFFV